MPKPGYVYIIASQRNGTLYTGVTSDLMRRVQEHRTGAVPGFTQEYGVHRLVYVETHADIQDAIRREKQVRKWNRAWKLRLIETENPAWRDLYADWCEALTGSRPVAEGPPSGASSRAAALEPARPGSPPARG